MEKKRIHKLPARFWIGVTLVSIFWYLNWSLEGLRTHWGFFPLWLGYSLTVDALVYYRTGTSLIKRSVLKYVSLFLISIPGWWLFEFFNSFTHNWSYLGREQFTDLEYALLASLSFSTVMPAVFSTAELVLSFERFGKILPQKRFNFGTKKQLVFLVAGTAMIMLIIIFPRIFYPLIWASVFFILEPLNARLGNRNLLENRDGKNLARIYALSLGTLICGFFWEMWNYYSYPKWIYDVPGVNFLHIFEMPLLGYLGYIPFSLELFAVYHFAVGFYKNWKEEEYVLV